MVRPGTGSSGSSRYRKRRPLPALILFLVLAVTAVVVWNRVLADAGDVDAAPPEVRDWEPRVAVVGEGVHALVARAARTHALVFEVGDGQAGEVAALLEDEGYGEVEVTRDLAGHERVVEGRRGR